MQLTNPLISAAETQAMIDAGADINATDKYGRMPLHWAAGQGKVEVISVLVQAGVDVNMTKKDGATPFRLAREKKRWRIAKYLESLP